MLRIWGWLNKKSMEPSYWNSPIDEITIWIYPNDSSELIEYIKDEDCTCESIRFGVDEHGLVFFWNGSINHTGVANALNRVWILTGIYKFDDKIYTSNNRYSQKQIDMESQSEEFKRAFEQLRDFNNSINEIRMANSILKF